MHPMHAHLFILATVQKIFRVVTKKSPPVGRDCRGFAISVGRRNRNAPASVVAVAALAAAGQQSVLALVGE